MLELKDPYSKRNVHVPNKAHPLIRPGVTGSKTN